MSKTQLQIPRYSSFARQQSSSLDNELLSPSQAKNGKSEKFQLHTLNHLDTAKFDQESYPNQEDKLKQSQRTRMHNYPTIQWLKRRFKNSKHLKKAYMLYPEEILDEYRYKKIFQVFDTDNSNALNLNEMVDMFNQFHINVTEEDIKKIYEKVDVTKDKALSYQEFKDCIQNAEANEILNQIMCKARADEKRLEQQGFKTNIYLPRNFQALIVYLSYLLNRSNKKKAIRENEGQMKSIEKMENFLELLKLDDYQQLKKPDGLTKLPPAQPANPNKSRHHSLLLDQSQTERQPGRQGTNSTVKTQPSQLPTHQATKLGSLYQLPGANPNPYLPEACGADDHDDDIYYKGYLRKMNQDEVKNLIKSAQMKGSSKAGDLYKTFETRSVNYTSSSCGVKQCQTTEFSQFKNKMEDYFNLTLRSSKKKSENPSSLDRAKASKAVQNPILPTKAGLNFNLNDFKPNTTPQVSASRTLLQFNQTCRSTKQCPPNYKKLISDKKLLKQSQIQKNIQRIMSENMNNIDKTNIISYKSQKSQINEIQIIKTMRKNSDSYKLYEEQQNKREQELIRQIKTEILSKFLLGSENQEMKPGSSQTWAQKTPSQTSLHTHSVAAMKPRASPTQTHGQGEPGLHPQPKFQKATIMKLERLMTKQEPSNLLLKSRTHIKTQPNQLDSLDPASSCRTPYLQIEEQKEIP